MIGVISDIHANLAALQAVLGVLEARGVRRVACLGDIVGYGPQPGECIRALRSRAGMVAILGNHDAAVLGTHGSAGFNGDAQAAVALNRRDLDPAGLSYLAALPQQALLDDLALFHGSPSRPLTEYLRTPGAVGAALRAVDQRFLAVGHTHDPLLVGLDAAGALDIRQPEGAQAFALKPGSRYLINAGAVGQPRDGDPRACLVLLDPAGQSVEFVRVAYDIEDTQRRMRALGYPESLVVRLKAGR